MILNRNLEIGFQSLFNTKNWALKIRINDGTPYNVEFGLIEFTQKL